MKRVLLVVIAVALPCLSAQAQDVKLLAEQIAKLQFQVNALEKKIAELEMRPAFTLTNGAYVFNAGSLPLQIRATSILLDSSTTLDLKAAVALNAESSGIASVKGSILRLNNGTRPAISAPATVSGNVVLSTQATVQIP